MVVRTLCAILKVVKPLELLAINQNLDFQKLFGENFKTSKDVIDNLSNESWANEMLLAASEYGNIFWVQFALRMGANIDTTDDKQNCPLHLAAENFFFIWKWLIFCWQMEQKVIC